MKNSLRILSACAVLAVTGSAFAQRAMSLAPRGIRVDPIAVATCRIVGVEGNKVKLVTGPWIPYVPSQNRPARQTGIAFDQFEFDFDAVTGDIVPTDGKYGQDCVMGGGRWFFGPDYAVGPRYNDMKVAPGAAGADSTRLGFTWYLGTTANYANSAHLVVTTENWVTDAASVNDPVARGDYPGVLYQFGPQVGPGGYFYSDVDLENPPSGLSHKMPVDGNGGYITAHGDYDGTTLIVGASQDMLWGVSKPANPFGPEDVNMWDDDNPVSGAFETGELYSYDYTGQICPDVLGAMMCFFYPEATTETLAPTAEQFVRGQGIAGTLASWAADDADPRNVRKFIVINQTEAFIRVNLDYTTTKANPTAISFVSKARMLDGGVFRISMSLRNDANAFVEVLPETAIGLSFATFTGNATGTLTDYVQAAGAMRGQIAVRQAGPSTAILPRSSFETGNMVVTG